MSIDLQKHWSGIYASNDEEILGWFEKDFNESAKFLEKMGDLANKTVFISGAGVSKVTELLLEKKAKLILNDISKEALKRLKSRLGEEGIEYFESDVSNAFTKECDIWLDRAVLHFLVDEKKITQYFENLKNSLKKGGYILFAEYTNGSPTLCANLPVHHYTEEEYLQRLGEGFEFVVEETFDYKTPSGEPKLYLYTLLKRVA